MWQPALEAFDESLHHMRNQNPPWIEKILEIEKAKAELFQVTGRQNEAAEVLGRIERLSTILSDYGETIAS